MKYLKTYLVDAIIFDNNYSSDDIKNDFESCPEGWNCVLKNEMSIDTMTEDQRNEFQNELFEYADDNAK